MSVEWSTCSVCESTIFVADVEPDGTEIWSHVEDNGCDDPTPSVPCITCGSDKYPLHINGECPLCFVPVTEDERAGLPILSLDEYLDSTDRKD